MAPGPTLVPAVPAAATAAATAVWEPEHVRATTSTEVSSGATQQQSEPSAIVIDDDDGDDDGEDDEDSGLEEEAASATSSSTATDPLLFMPWSDGNMWIRPLSARQLQQQQQQDQELHQVAAKRKRLPQGATPVRPAAPFPAQSTPPTSLSPSTLLPPSYNKFYSSAWSRKNQSQQQQQQRHSQPPSPAGETASSPQLGVNSASNSRRSSIETTQPQQPESVPRRRSSLNISYPADYDELQHHVNNGLMQQLQERERRRLQDQQHQQQQHQQQQHQQRHQQQHQQQQQAEVSQQLLTVSDLLPIDEKAFNPDELVQSLQRIAILLRVSTLFVSACASLGQVISQLSFQSPIAEPFMFNCLRVRLSIFFMFVT